MVKFGRHLQFYMECEQSEGSHYIVPYNLLRDSMNSIPAFERAWRDAMNEASRDYIESMNSCWKQVFHAISSIPQARGAPLETALRMYTPKMGITASQDLLQFLKGISSAANMNTEALRKLVKKFDKFHNEKLCELLLPDLYSSSFAIGNTTLNMAINVIRDMLSDDQDEESDDLENFHFDGEYDYDYDYDDDYDIKPYRNKSRFYTNGSESEDTLMVQRAEELDLLNKISKRIDPFILKHAVAHRGFHNPDGRGNRPLENSLAAFEAAWSNGIHLCECDIALTKDEKLVLAHDINFSRLALNPSADHSNTKVSDLTLKELIALTLKNGVRAPLLLDILRSAHTIGEDAKLIIEIKPGNSDACKALARLFARYPELMNHVEVVMSFDLWAMHDLRTELRSLFHKSSGSHHLNGVLGLASNSPSSHDGYRNDSYEMKMSNPSPIMRQSMNEIKFPKLMLLTVAHAPNNQYELWVDVSDLSPIDSWLVSHSGSLDGVYLRYQSEMLETEGRIALGELAKKYTVGIWGKRNKDPDNYKSMKYFVEKCGVQFYNTDLPRDFLNDDVDDGK